MSLFASKDSRQTRVERSYTDRRVLIFDIVGVLAIGLQLAFLITVFVTDEDFRSILGVIGFLGLAGFALYLWHKDPPLEFLTRPGQWALATLGSAVLGCVSFAIDIFVGSTSNPGLSPFEAGTKAGSPFGFPLTVLLCPGFTMIAVAGLLRALLLQIGIRQSPPL
jgi:hypothetical protein